MQTPARLLAILAAVALPALLNARTLIHAGTVIDGISDTPKKTVTLVVEKDRIVDLVDGFSAPAAGDTVIELKDATVLPGLIDCHVHLCEENSPKSYTERFYLNPTDTAYRSTVYARRTLMAGFTTVRDLGNRD
ncbi:MAG TPA: amidohydrolase family protein, partial [Candidatus Didemnitutus sp.]